MQHFTTTKSGRDDVNIQDVCWSMAHSTVSRLRGHTVFPFTYGLEAMTLLEECNNLGLKNDAIFSVLFNNGIANCYSEEIALAAKKHLGIPSTRLLETYNAIANTIERINREIVFCTHPNMIAEYQPRVVVQKLLKTYRELKEEYEKSIAMVAAKDNQATESGSTI